MDDVKLEKPKIGQLCNGCGICCKLNVCKNGSFILGLVNQFGDDFPGECPALVSKSDGTFSCGIAETPNKYIRNSKYPAKTLRKHFSNLIGVGRGCDGLLDDGTDTPEEEEALSLMLNKLKQDREFMKSLNNSIKIIHGQ